MRKLRAEKRAAILTALVEGCSVATTCRMTGVSKVSLEDRKALVRGIDIAQQAIVARHKPAGIKYGEDPNRGKGGAPRLGVDQDFAFYATDSGFTLVHLGYNPRVTPEVVARVTAAVGAAVGVANAGAFKTDTLYFENNWSKDRDGQAFAAEVQDRAAAAGSPDLLARLDGRLGAPLQRVYDEFAAKGLGQPGRQPGAAGTEPRSPELNSGPIAAALAKWVNAKAGEDGWIESVWAPALRATGKQLSASSRNYKLAAARAVEDIHEFLTKNPLFLGYYNKDWEATRSLIEGRFPEVKARPELFGAFRLFMGLTSPSTRLPMNVGEAIRALGEYIERGNFDRLGLRTTAKGNTGWGPGGNALRLGAGTGPHKARTSRTPRRGWRSASGSRCRRPTRRSSWMR